MSLTLRFLSVGQVKVKDIDTCVTPLKTLNKVIGDPFSEDHQQKFRGSQPL